MRPGERLPSHREIVSRFEVSATTVSGALAVLAQRGLVQARPGAGTFKSAARGSGTPQRDTSWQEASLTAVNGLEPRSTGLSALLGVLATQSSEVLDLNSGYLHPRLQPAAELSRSLARAARDPAAWQRPPSAGLAELRTWFAAEIGGGLGREDILIAPGGQTALSVVLGALGRAGEKVLVEAPTYPGTLAACAVAGVQPIGVPLDRHGVQTHFLEEALRSTGARLIVVQPFAQNPTGASLSAERRAEIQRIAHAHGAFVVEDDYTRYLVHADAEPPPAPLIVDDPHGSVIHIRSVTKASSSNLRVAAVAARGPVMVVLRAALAARTLFVPMPLQLAALDFLSGAGWRGSLKRLADELAVRRQAAAEAVRDGFGADALHLEQRGGYHLWVRLADGLEPAQLAAEAMTQRVAVSPGGQYQLSGLALPHIRLSYVATESVADVVTGVRRVAAAAETLVRGA